MGGVTRARPLEPQQRRAQLLDAARAVFAERGFFRTSVADIIDRAGVARGTFYNYFDSKRVVFDAVLAEVVDGVESAVVVIDVTRSIPEQVRANLAGIVGALVDADAARLLFAEAPGIDEDGDEALRLFYGRAVERIAKALRRGQAMGIVRTGDDRLMARCLLGSLKEPVAQAALFGERADADAIVTELEALLLGGILRRS